MDASQSIEARSSSRRFPGGESAFVRAQRLGHTVGASTTVRPPGAAAVVQRDNYRAKDKDSPPYGWLQGLAGILNTTAGVGNWCYSGSFALFCWAWVKDSEARDPKDVDILVADDKFDQVVAALAERGQQGRGHTGYTPVDLTLKVIGLDESETLFPVKIDVQRSGSKYGDVADHVQLDGTNNFPVASIEALIGRKMKASELVRMQREFADDFPLSKDENDLELLKKMKGEN